MSTTLSVQDVIFAGGQRAAARRAVDVSMETLASVWAGALRASEPDRAADLSDVQYGCHYSSPQLSPTPCISPHLQKNKQLQDTLQQREEEVFRLQQENDKLRSFLNSAFITNLQEKTKKLPSDTRSKLKRSLLRGDNSRTLQNPGATGLRKRVCRNLLPELCAAAASAPSSSPSPPSTECSEEPDPLDLWVLRTLGLKDRDTIDTSALPPPPPSEYGRDRVSPTLCSSQYGVGPSSDDTKVPSPHSAVPSSCEYGLEAVSYVRSSHRASASSSDYPLRSPFASSNPPPRLVVGEADSYYCRAPGAPPLNYGAAVNPAASPETDIIIIGSPGNCRDATALNASVQDRAGTLDGCPNFTAVASADQYRVNVSVTDNYRPAAGCQPAASQRDAEIRPTDGPTLTPPPSGKARLPPVFVSDQVQFPERNPGGYLANRSPLLQRSNGGHSQQRNVRFTRHPSPALSATSPELFSSPLPHDETQPQPEFTSSPQTPTTTTPAAASSRAERSAYQSPCLQRDGRSPPRETVALAHSPQTRHSPSSLASSPVASKWRQSPPGGFVSNPPTSPPDGAALSARPAPGLPRGRTDVAFSMSLSPSSSVKTHSFPQGQAFVKRDTQGQWRFTWVPKQGP